MDNIEVMIVDFHNEVRAPKLAKGLRELLTPLDMVYSSCSFTDIKKNGKGVEFVDIFYPVDTSCYEILVRVLGISAERVVYPKKTPMDLNLAYQQIFEKYENRWSPNTR
jgi:hypothetical protein